MSSRHIFVGGDSGPWRVLSTTPHRGAALELVPFVERRPADIIQSNSDGRWMLTGVIAICATPRAAK